MRFWRDVGEAMTEAFRIDVVRDLYPESRSACDAAWLRVRPDVLRVMRSGAA